MTETTAPPPKWKVVGPGLVVAATGIGAADLVATLVAGSRYGYALLWVIIVGVVMKVVLVEGAGRYTLASGNTIFQGWRSLGKWTTVYFAPYIVIWGFVYGAAAMSSSALPIVALFPALDLKVVAIASGLLGFALISLGSYGFFEKIITVFVGIMFVTVIGAAVVAVPNVPAIVKGIVPTIPDGSIVYVLGLAGGVGGTITLAAYGYWLREKGWITPKFMRVMRIDNSMAYVISGIFVLAMLIVGAELLYSSQIAISTGDQGLVQLSDVLAERYGTVFGYVFLIGFWSASFSSLIGVWNGVSLMFADFVGNLKGLEQGHSDTRVGGKYFRWYVAWLTFPPMALLWLDQPIGLVLTYGVLGAVFMPFLAVTLLILLNSDRVPTQWRNGWFTNLTLGVCALLFAWLAVDQVLDALDKYVY
ncbi:Nramp family divalent metal transporter [Rhodococcus sp. ARC_M5]|uniref:Nramp family divalent metal transporter n=1 Tax=Rhodococcus sp. ARC_M5 TaxID=2928851 RepID=UPI001FB23BEC|nr:Nramp family divalent metal transporter [Rhodococcus sp. ARC_M5]MCJ0892485.1 Nramp family divalent metal transporter [Rhodococcus sp. ARC_M5]